MHFDSLNFGKKFYARYDRRHDISLVGTYRIKKNITLSGTWVYGTGNAVSMPTSVYYAPDHHNLFPELQPESGSGISNFNMYNVNDYSQKNNYRMAPYHRLDLGIQFHKQKKWGERIWELSVYNAYSRKNPFFYRFRYTSTSGGSSAILEQVSLFPVIPSLTYSFKF
jgi:hypothetical protein